MAESLDSGGPGASDTVPVQATPHVEWSGMEEILQKFSLKASKLTSKILPGPDEIPSMEGVIPDLVTLFGDIGQYGLVFKVAGFIQHRVEIMKDVDERIPLVAAQAKFIQESLEKVEIQFSLSDKSILTQATEVLLFCAKMLLEIQKKPVKSSSGSRCGSACTCPDACSPWGIWLRKFVSAPAEQSQLVICENKLKSFRDNLSIALLTRHPIPDLPALDGPEAIGIDAQIDEVLEFVENINSDGSGSGSGGGGGGVSYLVTFCGVQGVGKSRLMFEVQKRFPAKSTIDTFYTMDFTLASDPISRLYLQQGLVEHLQGTGTATALRSTGSGKATIKRCLAFLKTKNQRVLFSFDNVGKPDDLTSILPLNLCEELPAGSCILVSLANNKPILRAITQVFPLGKTCKHKHHLVPPLKDEDAKELFCLHAGSLRPGDKLQRVADEIVARCEGLPLLLKAVGQVDRADWQAVLDALTKAEDVALVPQLIEELTSDPIAWKTEFVPDAHAHRRFSGMGMNGLFRHTGVKSNMDFVPLGKMDGRLSRMDMEDSRRTNAALNKRLDSKLKVVFRSLDEDLQIALDDIGGSLSGWDWKTVEAILGTDLDHGKDIMKRLADRSLIVPEVSKGRSLATVANLTRYSGPGPWKTNVVALDKHVPQPSNPVRLASLVELDHPEAVTPERIQGVKYLVLHNSKLKLGSSRLLADLKFLYWSVGSDDTGPSNASFTFPFQQGPDVLPQLKMLIISGNLDVHGFTMPSELPRFILTNCSATRELPEAMFSSRKLEELHLRDCPRLASLHLPQKNNHLQTLCLERCHALKSLPTAIAGLEALRTLELLSCDGLEELEAEGIGRLENLRALSVIGCNRLAALPHDIKNVSTLKSLNLSFCLNLREVMQIGDGFGELEELDLTGCSSIRKLPPEIKMLKSLTRLKLNACSNLVSLPDEIGELRNLQDLEMGFCIRVCNLPAGLTNLASLRRLMLTECSRLEALPEGLHALIKLEYLNLLGCSALDQSQSAKVIHRLRAFGRAVVHAEPADFRTAFLGDKRQSHTVCVPKTTPVSKPAANRSRSGITPSQSKIPFRHASR